MDLRIPLTFETYAIWLAVWIGVWTVVAFVWLQVHWIRKAVRAYHELSPAERLLKHARQFREKHAKPAWNEMQRHWNEWRRKRARG